MLVPARATFDPNHLNTKFDGVVTTNLLSHQTRQWPSRPEPISTRVRPLMTWCCPQQLVMQTNHLDVLTHALHVCADLWSPNVDGERVYHVRYFMQPGETTPHRKLRSRDYASMNQVVLSTCDRHLATQFFYMLCEVVDVAQKVWSKVDYMLFQVGLKERWKATRHNPETGRTAADHVRWLIEQLPSAPATHGGPLTFNFLFAWMRRDAMLHVLEQHVRTLMRLPFSVLVCDTPFRTEYINHKVNTPTWWLDFVDEHKNTEFAAALADMRVKAVATWGPHAAPRPGVELLLPRPVSDHHVAVMTALAEPPEQQDDVEVQEVRAPPTLVCARCGEMQGPTNACWCCPEDEYDTTLLYDETWGQTQAPQAQSPPPMQVFAPPSPPPLSLPQLVLERQITVYDLYDGDSAGTSTPPLSWADDDEYNNINNNTLFEPPPHWPTSWDEMADSF